VNCIVANITTVISGILSAIGEFLSFGSGQEGASSEGWTIIMALALAGGLAALGIRLVKKLGR
jgi:uncharacterized protein (TIGR03382 family)